MPNGNIQKGDEGRKLKRSLQSTTFTKVYMTSLRQTSSVPNDYIMREKRYRLFPSVHQFKQLTLISWDGNDFFQLSKV